MADFWLPTIAALAVITLSIVIYKFKNSPKLPEFVKRLMEDSSFKRIKLMDLECTRLLLNVISVNTITFYEGTPEREFIAKRVDEIVKANPWLNGLLIQPDMKNPQGIELVYSESGTNDAYSEQDVPNLCDGMNYEEMVDILDEYLVLPANQCINTHNPLFRVTLLTNSTQPDKFAILFSINHVIADGYTYYRLFGMLDESTPVEALVVNRVHGYRKTLGDTILLEFRHWLFSVPTIFNMLRMKFFAPLPTVVNCPIDLKWIETCKKEYEVKANENNNSSNSNSSGKQYISSNDIITTGFFHGCGADVGLMTCNTRGRLPGVNSDLAGNYETLIPYNRPDYELPEYIRASLATLRRTISEQLPSGISALFSKICLLSSWATLHTTVNLPNSRQTNHIPIVKKANFGFSCSAVIYKPMSDKLAILIFLRGEFHTENSPFRMEQLS